MSKNNTSRTTPAISGTFLTKAENDLTHPQGEELPLDIDVKSQGQGFDFLVKKMRGPIEDYQGNTAYQDEFYAVLVVGNGELEGFPKGKVAMAKYLALHSDPEATSTGTVKHKNGKASINFLPANNKYTEVAISATVDDTHAWIHVDQGYENKKYGYSHKAELGHGAGIGIPHYGQANPLTTFDQNALD